MKRAAVWRPDIDSSHIVGTGVCDSVVMYADEHWRGGIQYGVWAIIIIGVLCLAVMASRRMQMFSRVLLLGHRSNELTLAEQYIIEITIITQIITKIIRESQRRVGKVPGDVQSYAICLKIWVEHFFLPVLVWLSWGPYYVDTSMERYP